MYRIIVKNRGKENNVTPGIRYCLTKRSLLSLVRTFEISECDYDLEKLIRICNDVFAWSDSGIDEEFWCAVDKVVDEVHKA